MKNSMRWRLRNGLLPTVAVLGLVGLTASNSTRAWADAEPNAKPASPGGRSLLGAKTLGVNSFGGVLVDYSVLESLARSPALLIPLGGGELFDEAPLVLRPPAGVAPTLIAPQKNVMVKLRPPPSLRTASAPKPVAPVRTPRLTEAAPRVITTPPTATAPTSAAPAQTAAATPAPAATAKPAPTALPQTAAAPPTPPPPAGAPRSLLTQPPQETKVAVLPPPAGVQAPAERPPAPPETKAVETTAETSKTEASNAETSKVETSKSGEAKTAALAPTTVQTSPDTFTIAFRVGVPDVPADAAAGLKTLAACLKADAALRVQLVAFASDPEKSVSRSRRLSTERAVNVRS